MFGSVGSSISQGSLRKQGKEAPRWGGWLGSIKENQQKLSKFLRAFKIREIPALVALARRSGAVARSREICSCSCREGFGGGNTTTASVWNARKELEEYDCLLSPPTPSSLARGPGSQSARGPEWFGPWSGQAVWVELRPAGIVPEKWAVREWSWHPWSLMSPWHKPPGKGPGTSSRAAL